MEDNPQDTIEEKTKETGGQEQAAEEVETQESEDITFSPGWMIMAMFAFLNELIDFISLPFDLTGIWIIINFAIDLVFLFIFLGWRIAEKGFSLSAIFDNKKQLLFFILEHIPVIEDFFPGWILIMLGLRKKKIVKKS